MKISQLLLLVHIFSAVPINSTEQDNTIKNIEIRLSAASKNYDKSELKNIVSFLTNERTVIPKSRKLYLLGLSYWCLELIGYCNNKTDEINFYGKQSLQTLDSAENSGADIYLCSSYKALACQILAGTGITSGTKYGPRAASELKKAQNANPQGYFCRLAEAINFNQAPKFVGGNPAKALQLLKVLADNYPDSVDVSIHLSDAYNRNGKKDDAQKLINSILSCCPQNLLAIKIARKIKGSN